MLKKMTCLLLFTVLLLLCGCTAISTELQSIPRQQHTNFSLYLQPLPQEIDRIEFHFEELVAVRESGQEIVVPLEHKDFSAVQVGRQLRLAHLSLPSGRYQGLQLTISRASLQGEAGRIELLPPQQPLQLKLPFTIQEEQVKTLFLRLNPHQLITDGAFFTPSFSLRKSTRLLDNAKGYVCNSGSDSLILFNKRTIQLASILRVGTEPVALALDQHRGLLYVALAGEDAISVIEVGTGSIIGRIGLRLGDRPTELELDSENQLLAVLNPGSDSLSIIDTTGLYEIGRVKLQSTPSGLFLAKGQQRAYVTHRRTSSISVVDMVAPALLRAVALDDAPIDGVSSVDGSDLYLINDFSNELTVLDTANLTTRDRISIGPGAQLIVADSATGLLYISRQNGVIAVVDPRSLMAIDSYRLPEAAADLTIEHEENALFVILEQAAQLVKLNLISKRELGRLPIEIGGRAVVVTGER